MRGRIAAAAEKRLGKTTKAGLVTAMALLAGNHVESHTLIGRISVGSRENTSKRYIPQGLFRLQNHRFLICCERNRLVQDCLGCFHFWEIPEDVGIEKTRCLTKE